MPGLKHSNILKNDYSSGCAVLFALPFAIGGTITFGIIIWMIYHDFRMQFWRPVPCAILATELLEDHDEGTTYQTTSHYRYEYANKTYESRWVALTLGKDNIGDFHERIYRELKQHQQTGQAFRCYVNPSHPSEAILFREARWEMVLFLTLFTIMFGGIGWGVLTAAAYEWWTQQTSPSMAVAPNLNPWSYREDWKNNELRYSDKMTGQWFLWFAIMGFLMSAPALFISGRELLRHHNSFALLGFIPTGLSSLVLYGGFYYGLRWQRFGDSVLQLASMPGVIGGTLIGTVRVDRRVKSPDGFQVRLICTQISGTGDSESKKVMWEDKRIILSDLSPEMLNTTAIPVQLEIPNDCLETTGELSIQPTLSKKSMDKITVTWKLSVTALTEGVNYFAEFEVPVFRMPASASK